MLPWKHPRVALVTIHQLCGWPGFDAGCDPIKQRPEVPHIMRALEREVFDAVWAAVEPLLPDPPRTHPLGCHRPRASNELCFRGILIRLVTGCSWVDVEAVLNWKVSDTTLRHRRDEWIRAGVFDALAEEALTAYDRIIGIDLAEVAIDGSQHKAPCGGEGTGPN